MSDEATDGVEGGVCTGKKGLVDLGCSVLKFCKSTQVSSPQFQVPTIHTNIT